MIKIEKIIDYSLIKNKDIFNQLIKQREKKIDVTIGFEQFNIEDSHKEEYIKNLNYLQELYEDIKAKKRNNVENFIFILKEYLSAREILVEKKDIKTSEYIYRLF